MKMIYCGLCGKPHEPAVPDTETQGDGCSADVKDGVLTGDYGSAIADGTRFKIVSREIPADGTIICDTCITSMLKKNQLELLSSAFGGAGTI